MLLKITIYKPQVSEPDTRLANGYGTTNYVDAPNAAV